MPTQIQTAFSKGEISPTLFGRVDAEMYRAALATARNVICHNYGGVSNRPGLRYLGPVKNHTYAPRFIPFKFKSSDTYLLEFGDLYMRVIRENGHVTEPNKTITGITAATPPVVTTSGAHGYSNGDEVYIASVVGMTQVNGRRFLVAGVTANTFQLNDQVTNTAIVGAGYTAYSSGGTAARVYTITTPYAIADVANIKFTQAADVMTLTHQNYAPRELTRTGHAAWALTAITFAPGIEYPPMAGSISPVSVSSSTRYKVTAVDKDSGEESLSCLGNTALGYVSVTGISNANPARVTTSSAHGLSTGDYVFFDDAQGMTQIDNLSFVIDVVNATQFNLRGVNSSAYGAWTSCSMYVSFHIITAITQSNPAKVTISNTHNLAQGDELYITGVVGMTELNGRRFTIDIVDNTSGTQVYLRGEDSTSYGAYSSGGRAHRTWFSDSVATNKLSWYAVENAARYNIYKELRGTYGYIGSSDVLTFTDASIVPDLTKGPPTERNPFLGTANYPSSVGYYEQRRVFGGSSDQPDTSFYSKIGGTSNFSSSFPTQADDPIQATLVSGAPEEIRHYVSGNDLLVFTEGAEWKVNSGPDSGFSPDTVKQKIQSNWGSSHIRPLVLGNTTMFVPQSQIKCRTIEYSFQTNGYVTSDLNTLAGHMFHEYILTDWSVVKDPDPLIVTIRADGDAPVLTLDVTAEVVAWARWDTRGNFESVGVTRAFAADTSETVYFVVKRTINGQTVRTIEYLADPELFDVRDSFFVDCGVTYDAPITITGTTAANPVVVTAPSHGLANGDYVDISDITWTPTYDAYDTETQPAQLNLNRFKVKNATANTFELTDESDVNINGSAYTAYVSGGKVRKCVTTISGLWHLVGSAVTVLADGVPVTGHTVSSTGTITLATRASRVHIGLGYTSDIETLNIETQQGTSQGKPKKISTATVRFNKSRGVYYGRDFTKMHQLTQTDFGVLGATTGLFTGDIPVDFPPEWESNGRMAFRQRLPLPMSIAAIVPDFEVGR